MHRRIFALLLTSFWLAVHVLAQGRGVEPDIAKSRRLALVIGNNAYPANPLRNAANDAESMQRVLADAGFNVTLKLNVTERGFEEAIESFIASIQPGDVALFYYSGHGIQFGGSNYLIPVDFVPHTAADVKYTAYPVDRLRDNLDQAGVRLQIIILDACRNNPFGAVRGLGDGGLAAMNPGQGRGVYIAFATAPGRTADDNSSGNNGLFTGELIDLLQQPGLTLDQIFNRVRSRVSEKSPGQVPWSNSSVVGDFFFHPTAAAAPAPVASPALDMNLELYQAVKESRDPAQLESAASRITSKDLAELLRIRARALKSADRASTAAMTATTRADYAVPGSLQEQADADFWRKDYTSAFPLFLQLANSGVPRDMTNVANAYLFGWGTGQDDRQALEWYSKAAQAGDPNGMAFLGDMYLDGRGGLQPDLSQAVSWYRKAAEAGSTPGMLDLGDSYVAGAGGLPKDEGQAVYWYRKAAEAGDPDGMVTFGESILTGRGGLPSDEQQAVYWIRKSADLGDALGMAALGDMYMFGRGGLKKDPAEATNWYRKSADLGNSGSMTMLGTMYMTGEEGVPRDDNQAVALLRKASDSGNTTGMVNLGIMYAGGRGGLPVDHAKAVSLFQTAAQRGDPAGMGDLGYAYETGDGGLRKNKKLAIEWYRKAAALGNDFARQQLSRLGQK